MSGSVIAVALAHWVFTWLTGPGSFGIAPFLAATVPLAIPIYNDYRKGLQMKAIQTELPSRVAAFASPQTSAMRSMVLGEVSGVVVAAILFL
jgi:hypothetical protein